MVTPSRRSASIYCYVRCLKLFIIVSNNVLYIKIHDIVVPLFYDVISKYDIIASTHMVAIGFFKLHGECNLALQIASTEKLETLAVIKFCQRQGEIMFCSYISNGMLLHKIPVDKLDDNTSMFNVKRNLHKRFYTKNS